jgi:hypothetical protein
MCHQAGWHSGKPSGFILQTVSAPDILAKTLLDFSQSPQENAGVVLD